MSAASSHQNSRSNRPRLVAADATKATVMAMPMSSIIPGWRDRISETAPVRNGQPPYAKTAVPRTGATRLSPGNDGSV